MAQNNIFCTSPWNQEDLLAIYRNEVVPTILRQGWAIDEMNCDYPQETLIDEIWSGYERWADELIQKEKLQQIEAT